MKITVLCSQARHPINAWLDCWIKDQGSAHDVSLARESAQLFGGDILFLISCTEIITRNQRNLYRKCLVIHASDVPRGRGWSPHVWQILEGKTSICISLIEAADKVDSGDIWHQIHVEIPKHFLHNEINKVIFDAEIELMDFAVKNFYNVKPMKQNEDIDPTYYSRRSPEDSKISPFLSIEGQFDVIRVCDPERFPAFFELYGHRYKIKLEKI